MIAPSVLNVGNMHLSRNIRVATESGIERFHIDIMDGHFAPNLSYGPELVKDFRRSFPFAKAETHLMSNNLDTTLSLFVEAGAGILEFRYEATNKPDYWLDYLKDHNVRCGMVINPSTPVSRLEPFLNKLDQVLLMIAKPGLGGQEFEEAAVERLVELQGMIKGGNLDLPIEVDDGLDREILKLMHDVGAKIFIVGSHTSENDGIEDRVVKLKKGGK